MVESADLDNLFNRNGDNDNSVQDYLRRAATACDAGDTVIGLHLYIAAFESAAQEVLEPNDVAVQGLKQAWVLACKLGERALAEYIFDKLEPYLDSDEVAACAQQLQKLALDKLEEFGLSRDELEDMAETISRDFLGFEDDAPMHTRVMLSRPMVVAAKSQPSDVALKAGKTSPEQAKASKSASNTKAKVPADQTEAKAAEVLQPASDAPSTGTYAELVGYDEAIRTMHSFGIGAGNNPEFDQLVKTLNSRHGLSRMPAADTLLFRSPAREDALRFVMATVGELDLPTVRLHVEASLAGVPVLCVMAQNERQLRLGSAGSVFEGRGVLVLEDIDLWGAPPADTDSSEGLGGFMMAHLSRGAREAINLIRTAVDNPDIYVLATASTTDEVEPFFCELLEPFTLVDIGYPTSAERVDIWMDIMRDHPSMRSVDRAALVKYSAHLPRYDIYMAAREAIDEAYKEGLALRRYVPVTSENIFEKLASCQPVESDEYHELEEAVIRDFRRTIDELEQAGPES